MPVLPFPEYKPDLSDTNAGYSEIIMNVLPQADGYGPFPGLEVFTSALPARPRGTFYGIKSDGTVAIYAGTATKLYRLDNTTLGWTDVSLGAGTYSTLADGENWSFAQFNNSIIATQKNDDVQFIDVNSGTAFADLGGAPPRAAHVTTINRFLVLSGLASNPNRVHWSGLNAITTWTSGTTFSDYQDLADGGTVQAVVGGEFGIIIQDSGIRRMVFSPGSDIVFQIDRIAKDIGGINHDSVVDAAGAIYFYSSKGFYRIAGDGQLTAIGKERVDRTFDTTYDDTDMSTFQGAVDPNANRIVWTYKCENYSISGWNKGLVYDYALDRWAPFELEGTALSAIARPGLTLESLALIGAKTITGAANNGSGLIRITVGSTSGYTTGDIKTIAAVTGTTEANGTWTITVVNATTFDLQGSTFANAYISGGYVEGSLDDLPFSLDLYAAATRPELAAFDDSFRLCFFTGDNLEASLTTAEQSGIAKRLFVRGLYPLTDAATAYASVGKRENLNATPTYTTEAAINTQGYSPQRASTRHARGKLRIPAATTWTYATGVEPDVTAEGRR